MAKRNPPDMASERWTSWAACTSMTNLPRVEQLRNRIDSFGSPCRFSFFSTQVDLISELTCYAEDAGPPALEHHGGCNPLHAISLSLWTPEPMLQFHSRNTPESITFAITLLKTKCVNMLTLLRILFV